MLKKIAGAGVLIAAVVIASAGCKKKAGWGVTAGEIPIGEYASLNGPQKEFGQNCDQGLQLAVEQINAAGGVLGKKLKLYTADDNSDSGQAPTAVQHLIDQHGVVAVIGEVASSCSLAAGSTCEDRKIPMLSPASTNPQVTVKDGAVRKYIFRICFTDTTQGAVDGEFAASQKWKNVAVLTNTEQDYSKGLSDAFQKAYAGKGRIIGPESYGNNDHEFEPQLQRIMQQHPDAVYVPGYYNQIPEILTQARQLGLNVPFFGGDGWDGAPTLACPAAEGDYYSDHFVATDPRPEVQKFVTAYRERWHDEPTAMAVLGYDAGLVMADAIKRAGSSDPEAITTALGETKDFPGASGTITIDADHNARKAVYMLKIVDHKATLYQSFPPQ